MIDPEIPIISAATGPELPEPVQHNPRPVRSNSSIVVINNTYTIVESNSAFTRLTGWKPEQTVGKQCTEVLQCRNAAGLLLCQCACPLRQPFLYQQSVPFQELDFATPTGDKRRVSVSFMAMPSDAGTEAVVLAHDSIATQELDRIKSNFISMVSHELRTPLNSIHGFIEIVLQEQAGKLNERQHEFLGYAHESAHQLMALVEDVLFISQAGSGQFQLRPLPLALSAAIDQLLHKFIPLAAAGGITLRQEIMAGFPRLYADPVRIEQVLTNLLNNAIKFTPMGGTVQVIARWENEHALISVTDTGAGIPFTDQSRIFERFYQSDNIVLTSQQGGNGLGLAIAKYIVEQHGGSIWVESVPNKGATFTFSLPLPQEGKQG